MPVTALFLASHTPEEAARLLAGRMLFTKRADPTLWDNISKGEFGKAWNDNLQPTINKAVAGSGLQGAYDATTKYVGDNPWAQGGLIGAGLGGAIGLGSGLLRRRNKGRAVGDALTGALVGGGAGAAAGHYLPDLLGKSKDTGAADIHPPGWIDPSLPPPDPAHDAYRDYRDKVKEFNDQQQRHNQRLADRNQGAAAPMPGPKPFLAGMAGAGAVDTAREVYRHSDYGRSSLVANAVNKANMPSAGKTTANADFATLQKYLGRATPDNIQRFGTQGVPGPTIGSPDVVNPAEAARTIARAEEAAGLSWKTNLKGKLGWRAATYPLAGTATYAAQWAGQHLSPDMKQQAFEKAIQDASGGEQEAGMKLRQAIEEMRKNKYVESLNSDERARFEDEEKRFGAQPPQQ